MRHLGPLLGAVLAFWPTHQAKAQDPWPIELVDPAAKEGAPADLLLPMPCGAAMAFQRILVPVDPANPLADLMVWTGQDGTENGYMEAKRPDYLRGPFDAGGDGTAYFMGRYELTEGQYRALTGDCAAPNRKDRIARGNLTWLEAQQLADAFSRWLHETAPPELPRRGMAMGFVRLPTETEWEFATRGGAAVDADRYAASRFFDDGALEDYAIFVAPGSSRGKVTAVGLKQPNPLGLYDLYGNVEELMLEPFRLTLQGRMLGQPGGIITRGGSAVSQAAQIYSAQRTEYTPYGDSGGNTNAGIGVRFVISAHLFSSDLFLDTVKSAWSSAPVAAPEIAAAPMAAAPPAGGPLDVAMTEGDARHLLGRIGFGAHLDEVAALIDLPRREAIAKLITGFHTEAETEMPFADGPVPAHWMAADLSKQERAAFMQDRRADAQQLEDWWLAEMAMTTSPQTERMVLFWQTLLAPDFDKVTGEVVSLARNNRLLRAKGAGDLRGLLGALLSDAATLRSNKADLNTSYTPEHSLARFLLSLTGEQVSDTDVADAAKVLTGLGINSIGGLAPTFDTWRHDDTPITLFGQSVANPDEFVEVIANHQGTARVLARRVWQEYVSPDLPPADVIDMIANRYSDEGRTFTALLQAVLEQPAFWSDESVAALPRPPVDLLVSAVRTAGTAVADTDRLREAAAELGQALYAHLPADPNAAPRDTPEARDSLMRALFIEGGLESTDIAPEPKPDRIYIRYAAEDFIGPPLLKVALYKGDALRPVWEAEPFPSVGGVDTSRYPFGEEGTRRWQLAEVAIPTNLDYDLIGAGFVGDRCCEEQGKTGDRNMVVDWMQVVDQRFSARGAEVQGSCGDGKQQNGELFCEGTVLFKRGSDSPLPEVPKLANVAKSKLVAERVVSLWMNAISPDSALSEAAIGLLHPRFGDFSADAIGLRVRVRGTSQPELVLDPTLCSPVCLSGDWPLRGDSQAVLIFPLEADAPIYDSLSDEQRRFVAALWMSLPDLFAEASKGQNANGTLMPMRIGRWQQRIAESWEAILGSRHADLARAPVFLLAPLYDGPYAKPRGTTPVTQPAGKAPTPITATREEGVRVVTNPDFNDR
jgi:uncharacterized protein (DUF1800 family)